MISRYEHLEDQLNDLTELHQNEMANLKQELASIEERVAYQAHERARDIQVRVWRPNQRWIQTKICKGCLGWDMSAGLST